MMEYFSNRYDFTDEHLKDVLRLDYLMTGFSNGFTPYLVAGAVKGMELDNPIEFADKLSKWATVMPITKMDVLYSLLEDIFGWKKEYTIEILDSGKEYLIVFTPDNLNKFFATFKTSKWN